jgi:HAD superfamily hydrolase (TIGR01450 family)
MTSAPITISAAALIERYDALLIDAYGVLVRGDGAIEHAATFIERLHQLDKPYLIVTNDASRLTETCAARYASLGVHIPVERIITSGSLLIPYFARHGLRDARCITIGGPDAQEWVRRAGGFLVDDVNALDALSLDAPLHAFILADLPDADPLAQVEGALSALIHAMDLGQRPHLILPNPDKIYPRGLRSLGLTGGAIAHMIEGILQERYPYESASSLTFTRLGKPHPAIFEEAIARCPSGASIVMIGDQLATDIAGARRAGLDAALVATGLTPNAERQGLQPTWLLPSLRLA